MLPTLNLDMRNNPISAGLFVVALGAVAGPTWTGILYALSQGAETKQAVGNTDVRVKELDIRLARIEASSEKIQAALVELRYARQAPAAPAAPVVAPATGAAPDANAK